MPDVEGDKNKFVTFRRPGSNFRTARPQVETLTYCFTGNPSETAGEPGRPRGEHRVSAGKSGYSRSLYMKVVFSKSILGLMVVAVLAGCAGLQTAPGAAFQSPGVSGDSFYYKPWGGVAPG